MKTPSLISDYIQPLQTSDTAEQALLKMHENNISQLPVVEQDNYVGVISIDEIFNLKHLTKPLSHVAHSLRRPFVYQTDHLFDAMKAAVEFNVRIVPVVDKNNKYIGIISAENCLRAFAVMNSVKEVGAIIELEKDLKDYSMSEVVRIVEENDAVILCFYTNALKRNDTMQITIKVNTGDIGGMLTTFERFNYEIKAVYNSKEYEEDLKDRYDALMRYLSV